MVGSGPGADFIAKGATAIQIRMMTVINATNVHKIAPMGCFPTDRPGLPKAC